MGVPAGAAEHERVGLVVGHVLVEMLPQLGLEHGVKGTVRFPALDFGGPERGLAALLFNELPVYPDGAGVEVDVTGRSAASSAQRRLVKMASKTSARYIADGSRRPERRPQKWSGSGAPRFPPGPHL